MNNYLIPANANRGKLIFGFFRPVDLIIFLVGVFITFILLLIFQNDLTNTWTAVLVCIPAAIAIFLVIPIPNQHNVLVVLINIYNFYFVNRNRFVWKGWCCTNDTDEKK